MTAIDTFDKQDIFLDRMIEDYKKGVIPHASVFAPYFRWKMGECVWIHISTETPGSNTRDLEKTNMSCRILKALTANCKISLPFCSKDSSAELQRCCIYYCL